MIRPFLAASTAALCVARAALAQCPDGTPPPCRARAIAPLATSIAVLYFDNLSRDSSDLYLADGFTDELITRLTQVERLQVKSRTAVQRFRGREADPGVVGRSLGVAHLVTGSVLRQNGRLRITVELTRIATGNSVWGKSFDRGSADLIRTEAEVAESVAVNVGARLAPAEKRRIEAGPTRNPAAYDHLLRGRFFVAQRTAASLLSALREFEQAIRLDSALTSAWVGLAGTNGQLSALYYSPDIGVSRDTLRARSLAALARAYALDSSASDVLIARASTGRASDNEVLLARAIATDPRNADAHHTYALNLRTNGRDSAAIEEFRKAIAIEPDKVISLENLAIEYEMIRRPREARIWIDSAVALHPEAAFYYLEQAFVRLTIGDTAGARASAEQAATHGNPNGREEVFAVLDARAGDTAAAGARLARIESALATRDCIVSHECLEVGMAFAMAGFRSKALDWLERLKPRSDWLMYWQRRPEFDAIRGDPRFQAIVTEARENHNRGQ